MKKKTMFGLFLFFLLIQGCTTQYQKNMKRVDALMAEASRLVKQQTLLRWFNIVYNKPMDISETYADHRELFSLPTIRFLNLMVQETKDKEKVRELIFFRNYLMEQYAYLQTVELNRRMELIRATPLRFKNSSFTLRTLETQIGREPDPAIRKAILKLIVPKVAEYHQLFREKALRQNQVARQLGFPDMRELAATMYNFSPIRLTNLLDSIVAGTDSIYRELLRQQRGGAREDLSQELPLGYLLHVISPVKFGDDFRFQNLPLSMKWFLEGIGIELQKQTNLRIQFEKSPQSPFGAYCVAVTIPSDVRLAVGLMGGFADYQNYFREMGRAQHFAHIRTKSWPFQFLGSSLTQDISRLLFQNVWQDSLWLNHFVTMPEERRQRFLDFLKLQQLFAIRHRTLLFRYQMALAGDADGADSLYTSLMSRYLLARPTEGEQFWDLPAVDDLCADSPEIQAFLIEPMLSDYLKSTYGAEWFHNPKVSEFFTPFWKKGNYWFAQEWLNRLGQKELVGGPFMQRFGSRYTAISANSASN